MATNHCTSMSFEIDTKWYHQSRWRINEQLVSSWDSSQKLLEVIGLSRWFLLLAIPLAIITMTKLLSRWRVAEHHDCWFLTIHKPQIHTNPPFINPSATWSTPTWRKPVMNPATWPPCRWLRAICWDVHSHHWDAAALTQGWFHGAPSNWGPNPDLGRPGSSNFQLFI